MNKDIYIPNEDIVIPKGKIFIVQRNVFTGKLIKELIDNTFMTVGKNSIADALRGTTENTKGIITYCALGLSAVAPAVADVKLGNELFRKLVSVRSVSGNAALFQTFFTTSEGNGSLKEAGLFGDNASGTADSGTLFAHAAINRTKTDADTLTLYWTVTIG